MLGVLAVAVALAIGLPLGIVAALPPDVDRPTGPRVTLLGIAVPFFVVAAVLVLLLVAPPRVAPGVGLGASRVTSCSPCWS